MVNVKRMVNVNIPNEARKAKLIVVRHGETTWNVEGRIQGQGDSPLSKVGMAQAEAVADALKRDRLDAIIASDLGRVRQTVEPLARATGIKAQFDAGLRERNYGVFEGRTVAELDVEMPGEYERFRVRELHAAPPRGESLAQFHARVAITMDRIAAEFAGRKVAVITHGGVCGELFRHAMRLPLEAPRRYSLFNAAINRLRCTDGDWQVDVWGDLNHLDGVSRDDT
jgi:probable phosphoglycerate mutase